MYLTYLTYLTYQKQVHCESCQPTAPPVHRWLSLELLLLSIGSASLWPRVAARTQQVVNLDTTYHCYQTMRGGPHSYMPMFQLGRTTLEQWRDLIHDRPRVAAFRRAVWTHASLPPPEAAPPPQRRIIFVLRRHNRMMSNEDELLQKVAADALLGPAVAFTRMEDVGPLTAQLELIAASRAIGGLHGQGLALTPFLPADGYACALLEVLPRRMGRQG